MIFANRDAAGRALAEQVARQVPADAGPPLVLALPRGGVPVAVPVAERLGADLDLVIARKIGAPGHPEYGVGAIAEDGPPIFDRTTLRYLGLSEDDLADTVAAERAELARRISRYRAGRAAPDVTGRTVVLVDDGLATGVTARAAIGWLRGRRPYRLVLAVPVCSRDARDLLAGDADTVVYLHAPEYFSAVGQWYDDFGQLDDADVDRALARASRRRTTVERISKGGRPAPRGSSLL
ncbi:phosphoribosyltransferase [Amorphoplanes digitatis]|uniref:Putative phosphoribosyltransferase n=1 Tax=Actinoplanes digitatis TaxID=1868 RepID=A0A7W7I6S3_9ACTN|nr:phosphoribosyltransferase family protein [Actinoplanes digitatis]MBB4767443.1 putative phosphoribosyltransferase [Actinoplanes digitatis]GID97868.1 phosphoribosyltransferase [Actinoplanes digitatis]